MKLEFEGKVVGVGYEPPHVLVYVMGLNCIETPIAVLGSRDLSGQVLNLPTSLAVAKTAQHGKVRLTIESVDS
jgi:hypothetical protein